MKRSVLVSMLVAPVLLALLVGGTSRGEPQTKEFVVAAWGDPYEAGWRKSLVPAFEKKYWVKVVWGGRASRPKTLAKLRAQKDNPQIEVAMMEDGPHRQAVALGLVDQIDRSKLSSAKNLYELAFEPNDMGISFGLAVYGLYYKSSRGRRSSRPGTSIGRRISPPPGCRSSSWIRWKSSGVRRP